MVGNEKGENGIILLRQNGRNVDELGHAALGQKEAGSALLEGAARSSSVFLQSGKMPQQD